MKKASRYPLPATRYPKEVKPLSKTKRVKQVMVFGTFDRIHPGHEFLLKEAARSGKVTVAVARNETVFCIKKRLPIESERQRVNSIKAKFPGFRVILGDKKDFLKPIKTYMPDLILLGYDQRLPPGLKMNDLPCPVRRIKAFRPEKYKSSLKYN